MHVPTNASWNFPSCINRKPRISASRNDVGFGESSSVVICMTVAELVRTIVDGDLLLGRMTYPLTPLAARNAATKVVENFILSFLFISDLRFSIVGCCKSSWISSWCSSYSNGLRSTSNQKCFFLNDGCLQGW